MSNVPETAPEKTLQEIAEYLFGRDPGPPNSINLQLTDDSVDDILRCDPDAGLQEMYLDLMRMGAKILYGEDFNLFQMSKTQYAHLNRYMQSVGVDFVVSCNDDRADPWDVVAKEGIKGIKFWRVSFENIVGGNIPSKERPGSGIDVQTL